jgi:hypothetical protein
VGIIVSVEKSLDLCWLYKNLDEMYKEWVKHEDERSYGAASGNVPMSEQPSHPRFSSFRLGQQREGEVVLHQDAMLAMACGGRICSVVNWLESIKKQHWIGRAVVELEQVFGCWLEF